MRRTNAIRHGMTLVELLVVVTILVILIAVAVPVMRPQLKDRKLREASRMLNTFISVAKARAIETGRPHGIWISRDVNNTNASYQVFLAESPVPFAGDGLGITATMSQGGAPAGYAGQADISDMQNLVQAGDYIQFDFKGPRYLISSANVSGATKQIIFAPAALSGEPYPRLISTDPTYAKLQFQVFRQPLRSSTQPLTLPTGTVIDLAYSGIGKTGTEMNGPTVDAVITFNPSGSIDRVLNVPYNIPGTVHLMIGRTDGTPALQTDATKTNIVDPTSSWVSIGHLTGTVTTAENFYTGGAQSIDNARKIAQQKQTMGGR
jgi:prepilin-type N-terminal cleavage/methylation domain-containing protein